MNESELTAHIHGICASVDYDLTRAEASLIARLRLLAEHSPTVEDARRMAGYAQRVFAHYRAHGERADFSDLERRIVVLACLFSDIGKTGPEHADAEDRHLIVEMFAVEGVRDDQQPVTEFFRRYFPADAARRTERFRALGLDPSMSIRQFWNLHSGWTLDIAEAAGLPLEAVAAAATHHLLDDVNPEHIVGDDQRFTRAFGDNPAFDRAEKLVIVLDKYDAVRRRGRKDHHGAIDWLRQRIGQHPVFRDDVELNQLVDDVDRALADLT